MASSMSTMRSEALRFDSMLSTRGSHRSGRLQQWEGGDFAGEGVEDLHRDTAALMGLAAGPARNLGAMTSPPQGEEATAGEVGAATPRESAQLGQLGRGESISSLLDGDTGEGGGGCRGGGSF